MRRIPLPNGLVLAQSPREIKFRPGSPQAVLARLLMSGAGGAFYDAIDARRRPALTAEFLDLLDERTGRPSIHDVADEYVADIGLKR